MPFFEYAELCFRVGRLSEANLERRPAMRLLLVEDDLTLGDAVRAFLKSHGHAVDWVTTVAGARAAAGSPFDVILLDWRLPDGSGMEWLRQLRSAPGDNQHAPVLMLTARDALTDRIEGLDAGADDYLIKPFQLAELAARIRSTSRRAAGHANGMLEAGEITLDVAGRTVTLQGSPIDLTAREYALLEVLMRRAGRILSRPMLEELLYGFEADVSSNTVEVHVASLRRMLGHELIETVRGMGYRLKA
jgi:two-component system OmpR family response regulator